MHPSLGQRFLASVHWVPCLGYLPFARLVPTPAILDSLINNDEGKVVGCGWFDLRHPVQHKPRSGRSPVNFTAPFRPDTLNTTVSPNPPIRLPGGERGVTRVQMRALLLKSRSYHTEAVRWTLKSHLRPRANDDLGIAAKELFDFSTVVESHSISGLNGKWSVSRATTFERCGCVV